MIRKRFPFHPLIFLFYFFAHLWAANLDVFFNGTKLFTPFKWAFIFTCAAWLFLTLLHRNFQRASFILSMMLLYFFGYGHFFHIALAGLPLHPRLISGAFLIPFILIPLLGFLHHLKRWDFETINYYLNIAAALILMLPMAQIATAGHERLRPQSEEAIFEPIRIDAKHRTFPDVYYIVLDEYGRADTLKRAFDFDNQPFLNSLKKKGFYIAEKSRSNYTITVTSLASSLNMAYLKDGELSMQELIKNNRLQRLFKQMGYQYIFVNSGMELTEDSPYADKTIGYMGVDEAQLLVVNSTLLKAYAVFFLGESWRSRHLYNFRQLGEVPEIKGAKFIFAHLLIPHPPFVFNRDGSLRPAIGLRFTPNLSYTKYQEAYPNQLFYLNQMLEELVQKLITSSTQPPIIILQSDHGLDPLVSDWYQPDIYETRIANFTAIYAPQELQDKFYPTITPVNIFRVIFKNYFGADIPLLPDKHFISRDFDHRHEKGSSNWIDMTERISKEMAAYPPNKRKHSFPNCLASNYRPQWVQK